MAKLKENIIYAIVVSYNGEKWIEQCISSLNSSIVSTNVVVIDNGSSDKTVSIIRTKFPFVHIIESKVNLGFGQANNKGINLALERGADFILLLNQDAWIQPDTISCLVNIAKQYPEYGVISPLHLKPNSNQLEYNFATFIGRTSNRQAVLSDFLFKDPKEIFDIDFVNAACWLLPRKCIEKVGGFDPIIFHYFEDDDFCKRVHYHEFKIGFTPNTKIFHAVDNFQRLYKNKREQVFSNVSRSMGYLVLQLKHNNGRFITIYLNQIFHLWNEAINDLFARNFYGIWFRLYLMLKMTKLYYRIKNSRKVSKETGLTYL
jgi:GT2 family glycosyltransferase